MRIFTGKMCEIIFLWGGREEMRELSENARLSRESLTRDA